MLVIKRRKNKAVHTFEVQKSKKTKDGYERVFDDDGNPVMEDQTYVETGEVVNGLTVVARVLGTSTSHVLYWVQDPEKEETK